MSDNQNENDSYFARRKKIDEDALSAVSDMYKGDKDYTKCKDARRDLIFSLEKGESLIRKKFCTYELRKCMAHNNNIGESDYEL